MVDSGHIIIVTPTGPAETVDPSTRKVPKKKISVRFQDGTERILREELREDPLRRRLCGTFEVSSHHVLSMGRR